MLGRRQLLGAGVAGAIGAVARRASAEEHGRHFDLVDVQVPGDRAIGNRFVMLVPKPARKTPLVCALHGLGETGHPRTGAWAWVERYGLGTSYDRLCEPPIRRVDPKVRYWTDERLVEVNALLEREPFQGIAVVCPYTPNVRKASQGRSKALDLYADWLVTEVLPRARKEADVFDDPAHTSLDGCSLGGYVGIEVLLRKPDHFGAWGTVQGAFGGGRAVHYAERLADLQAQHGKRRIHVETSTDDTFRDDNEALARELTKRGVDHDFTMPPGPHNQPFLRDSGTVEMLLWHDRLPR
jgi:iron(III)-salmochelin esterase